MGEKWRIYNFVTGRMHEPHELPPGEPMKEWVEGWNAYMIDGWKDNPYPLGTIQYNDYEAGWAIAKEN
jgi:hypothetical protein